MKVFDATAGASGKDGAAIVAPEQSTPASAKPDASAGTSPESGVGTHTESPSRSPGGGEPPAAKTELDDGHGGAESAHSIGIAEGSGEANGTRTAELTDAASPWYRRPGILIAAAALIAEVGIVVSGPGEPGTAPGGTTGTSTPWSASFSLIATTEFWVPPPPPPAAPPAAAPPAAPRPSAGTPPCGTPPGATPGVRTPSVRTPTGGTAASSAAAAGVKVRRPPGTAFVSIANNDKPAVGCMYRSVAVAGTATMVNYRRDYPFTVTGSAETRIDPDGPATGSTFHVTVTCDNGLSTSLDRYTE